MAQPRPAAATQGPSPHQATAPRPRVPPQIPPADGAGGEHEIAQPAFWWLGLGAATAAAATYLLWPSADLAWDDFLANPSAVLGNLDLVPAQAFAPPVSRTRRGTRTIPTVREYPCATTRICLRRDDHPPRYTIVVDRHRGRRSRPAAYLPWSAREACRMELDNTADIFLTDRLNGCGIIFAGSRANPSVVHANHYTGVEDLDATYRARHNDVQQYARVNALRENEYRSLARAIGLNRGTIFSPRQYFAAGQPARVFGVRRRVGWTFYAITRPAAGGFSTAPIWP
ncbi:hypothetical protein [Sorangium sp. So ce887]|uniref:hypothetical protein n=1 Tax=Sorangium sp. So ce887 TaxID=3133324 RepID=UPI003F612719